MIDLKEIADKYIGEKAETASLQSCFIAGYELAKFFGVPTEEILAEVSTWDAFAINEFVYGLLKTGKLSYADLTQKYICYLKEINKEKNDLIYELGTSLMTFRQRIYTHNELPVVEKTADDVLRKTNLFNY